MALRCYGVRRDGVESDASGAAPVRVRQAGCAPSETTVPRAELRFAAPVPLGCGVLRHAPNAFLAVDRDCFAGFTRRARWALEAKLVRASSSEAAEGSGGPPASHVKMRRPTGEQCFQSKPDLVMMGQPAGPSQNASATTLIKTLRAARHI